jgi:hypothetical protein
MTRDEIIKLAQEAKLLDARAPGETLTFEMLIERLVEFAAAIRARGE